MSRKPNREKLRPLAFRLYESERETLKRLAREWQTTQIGVLRRLLAMAEREVRNESK